MQRFFQIAIGTLVLVFVGAALAAPANAEKVQLADAAWSAGNFNAFRDRCREIEEETPSFEASFNVALGYARVGDLPKAMEKLEGLKGAYTLGNPELRKVSVLKSQIEAAKRFSRLLAADDARTAAARAQPQRPRAAPLDSRGSVGLDTRSQCEPYPRNPNCPGLTDEESAQIREELGRRFLHSMGYDVGAGIKVAPEKMR